MKRWMILLLLLIFVSNAYAAYTAPNEDTVVIVGGLGTQANKAQLNGGGATKTVWDAGTPSDFINTNGGPKRTASCAFTTATKNLNGTDIGNGVTAGTLCYVSTGDGSQISAGVYEITTVTDNDNIICAQIDDLGSNDTGVTVNVGGALDGLQNALDNPVNNGALYNRYIYDNIATETVTVPIDVDTFNGTTTTKILVIGYNSTLAAEATVIIDTTSDIASILALNLATNHIFKKIDFYGGGKDASRASYCVADSGIGNYNLFVNCKFRGAESHGIEMDADRWYFYKCEFYLNGGSGMWTGSSDGLSNQYISCSFHDNDSHGLFQDGGYAMVQGCLAYDNGKDGTGHGFCIQDTGDSTFLRNNTAHGNADSGFFVHATCNACLLLNNTSVGNGAYGYDLNGQGAGGLFFFGYNHASVNTTAHYSEGIDNTFAAFGQGSNQADTTAAADLFTSVADGSEDFTPKAGVDLIDNALDAGTN